MPFEGEATEYGLSWHAQGDDVWRATLPLREMRDVGCDCGRGGECMNPERIVGLSAGVPVCDCEREGECTNLGFKAGRCCKCGGARHEALQ